MGLLAVGGKESISCVACICYHNWHALNKLHFERKLFSARSIHTRTKDMHEYFLWLLPIPPAVGLRVAPNGAWCAPAFSSVGKH